MQQKKTDIKSMNLEELKSYMESIGEKAFRAKQLYQWMHQKQASSFDEMTNLSKSLQEKLKNECHFVSLKQEAVQISKLDGTRKYLFALDDGNVIESVLMRYKHGNSVCISSQVGCRMGCRFCASTLDGLVRGLTPSEMLDQIYRITRDTGERVSNVVVMGTGEPMDNFDNLLRFIELLTDENGLNISQRNVTVSTCGIVPKMRELADKKLQKLNKRTREELPLSDLLIGMQCGGSDAFSGISANPSAGYAADMLVRGGATVMFSEVTEVRDGVHMLAARCPDAHTRDRLAEEMKWYDKYLAEGGVGRDANPTPGNKAGGLANIVEKAMGSIAKSGTSQIVEVLSPAQKPTKHGLIYAATPASDIVCGPSQVASGIGLQVFMTGRGTPYGLDISPVIKVCSRNELKNHWFDMIDISAGDVATGEKTIADVGQQIFDMILDVASGTKQPYSDQYGFHNDMCIFNPAPIT